MIFKYELGVVAESKVYGLSGTITARSENLYGCNRYYIQPKVDKEGKMRDGYWLDEEDILLSPLVQKIEVEKSEKGGPASRIK